ncbi:hypothetical protein NQD34_015957 [Periophthalmus magnuspinnatus]|nr:hypothetical protein NQD34_015957 [Periophthalmus magnuspinnatus]
MPSLCVRCPPCSEMSFLFVSYIYAPMTMGTTDAFPFQVFSTSSLSPWYFSRFSCSHHLVVHHNGSALLIIQDYNVRLVHHHVSLYLEVSQDLGSIILHYLWRCF